MHTRTLFFLVSFFPSVYFLLLFLSYPMALKYLKDHIRPICENQCSGWKISLLCTTDHLFYLGYFHS